MKGFLHPAWFCVTSSLVLSACSSGPCDNSSYRNLGIALNGVSADLRQSLAAQGLKEACELPPGVEEGLEAVAAGWPGTLGIADIKVATVEIEAWKDACPGGLAVLSDAAKLAREEGRRKVYRDCQLSGPGLATEDQFARGQGLLVLPVILAHQLKDEDPGTTASVLQALTGTP